MGGKWKAMGLAVVLPWLSACAGFTPLYAEPGVSGGLSRIDVTTPDTRTGYLLREALEDAFATDRAAPADYRLNVELAERRTARGLRVDDTAARFELGLTVTYTLVETATGAVLLNRTAQAPVTYDAADQPFAGITAQQEAQARAATAAAEIVRTDLARWFATR
ncbi:MAG TPA: LPS assembly lipoprotein LptE [Caulobacteraceae bacterium]|nr:LPS assembly lipoprotein LptE [Caulobacteraceae bacterium]